MAFKFVLLVVCAVFARANAGGVTLTSGSDNTYRSQGNLAQLSTQSKTIETPYSSSSKTDIRVSNPSVYSTYQPPLSYSAQPAHVYASAVPTNLYGKVAYVTAPQPTLNYAAPVAELAQAYYPQQRQQATYQNYATQAVYPASHQQIYTAPPSAVVAKTAYAAPASYHVAEQSPVAYAAPATYAQAAPAFAYNGYSHAAPLAAHQPLVKVAWSPANEVAHLTYSNVNDHITYAW